MLVHIQSRVHICVKRQFSVHSPVKTNATSVKINSMLDTVLHGLSTSTPVH